MLIVRTRATLCKPCYVWPASFLVSFLYPDKEKLDIARLKLLFHVACHGWSSDLKTCLFLFIINKPDEMRGKCKGYAQAIIEIVEQVKIERD